MVIQAAIATLFVGFTPHLLPSDDEVLLRMEKAFQLNGLEADLKYGKKKCTAVLYVNSVDKVKGKPTLFGGITYFTNGTSLYVESTLSPSILKSVAQLRSGDKIEVTATFLKRERFSKERIEVNTVFDRVYGGTVTDSWVVYFFDTASFKMIETEANRVSRVAREKKNEENRQASIVSLLELAAKNGDVLAATKAIALRPDKQQIQTAISLAFQMEPNSSAYPNLVKVFNLLITQPNLNFDTAIFSSLGVIHGDQSAVVDGFWIDREIRKLQRPKLFASMVNKGLINLEYVARDGASFLRMLLARPMIATDDGTGLRVVGRFAYTENDVEIVRSLLATEKGRSMVDKEISGSKSALDFMKKLDPGSLGVYGKQILQLLETAKQLSSL